MPRLVPGHAASLVLTTPDAAPPPLSYDGFPELRAELFESPREQAGALPVPGPSRSAPSSPAPRRTKQVPLRRPTGAPAQPRGAALASSVKWV